MNEPKLPKNNDPGAHNGPEASVVDFDLKSDIRKSFSCISCKTLTLSESKVMVISIRHCTKKRKIIII
jgi:hypothetical protein